MHKALEHASLTLAPLHENLRVWKNKSVTKGFLKSGESDLSTAAGNSFYNLNSCLRFFNNNHLVLMGTFSYCSFCIPEYPSDTLLEALAVSFRWSRTIHFPSFSPQQDLPFFFDSEKPIPFCLSVLSKHCGKIFGKSQTHLTALQTTSIITPSPTSIFPRLCLHLVPEGAWRRWPAWLLSSVICRGLPEVIHDHIRSISLVLFCPPGFGNRRDWLETPINHLVSANWSV